MKPIVIIAISVVLFSPLVVFAEDGSKSSMILSNQIPIWIKNTAGWWSEDKISDQEFLSAISYLRESQIITIPIESELNILNNTETILETENDEESTL